MTSIPKYLQNEEKLKIAFKNFGDNLDGSDMIKVYCSQKISFCAQFPHVAVDMMIKVASKNPGVLGATKVDWETKKQISLNIYPMS